MTTTRTPAAYLRLSVATDDSVSIAGQRELVTEEARRRGWTSPTLYVDEGISGSKDVKRPGRDALETALRERRHSALIVKSVDRLARSTADFARIAALCQSTGTDLVVTDLSVDTTSPGGRMVLDVLAAMASFEAAMIGSRIRAANVERMRQGRSIGGRPPYHLQNVKHPDGGTVRALDEERAPVALEIVLRVLDGESYRAVAIDLNRRGVPAPRARAGHDGEVEPYRDGAGATWAGDSVRHLARNPALAGMTTFRGEVVRDAATGLPKIDSDLAVIDYQTHRRLIDTTSARTPVHKPRRTEADRLLMEGIARCETCGHLLARAVTRGYVSYNCNRGTNGSCEGRGNVSQPRADEYVTDVFMAEFGAEPVMRMVPVEVGADRAAQELRLILAEVEDTRAALAADDTSPDLLPDLAARLKALRLREVEVKSAGPRMFTLEPTGETERERWERSSIAERRETLGKYFATIWVRAGRLPVGEKVRLVVEVDEPSP